MTTKLCPVCEGELTTSDGASCWKCNETGEVPIVPFPPTHSVPMVCITQHAYDELTALIFEVAALKKERMQLGQRITELEAELETVSQDAMFQNNEVTRLTALVDEATTLLNAIDESDAWLPANETVELANWQLRRKKETPHVE